MQNDAQTIHDIRGGRGFAYRFFGGSPVGTVVRLAFVSLVVGALLMWLDIEPLTVVRVAQNLAARIWNMGFEAVHEMGRYLLAGALIVVPVWLVTRLLSFRGIR